VVIYDETRKKEGDVAERGMVRGMWLGALGKQKENWSSSLSLGTPLRD